MYIIELFLNNFPLAYTYNNFSGSLHVERVDISVLLCTVKLGQDTPESRHQPAHLLFIFGYSRPTQTWLKMPH